VVRVFAHGELEGLPYMAMEPLEGLSLAQLLAGMRPLGKKLPLEVACYIASEMAAALAHAHGATETVGGHEQSLGLVHRDVRPANVLLLPNGSVKLIEFGVAQVASFVSQSVNVGAGTGKSSYVSPEQLSGAPLDGRSDVFSLGVVLWEMLCGRALFPPTAPGEAVARVTSGALPRPSSVRTEIPAALDQLVMRLLERNLPGRYPSARLLVRDLEAFIPARNDSQRAVSSMVKTGPEAEGKVGAVLADAVAAASTDRAAGRRPVTRVVPNIAAILASARMRQLASRIPGSVRRITGLVPVVASRLLRRTPARPVTPPPTSPKRPAESNIATAVATAPSPIPALLQTLLTAVRPRVAAVLTLLTANARRPAFLARAVAVMALACLGGVGWHHLSGDASSAATPPLIPATSRLAGVRIESLPPRPLDLESPQRDEGTALEPLRQGQGAALRSAGAHQGQGTALRAGRGRRKR
jgi:serine/threonine-protein kinase